MRLREGLVKVEVDSIKAHQTRRSDAQNSVEVRPIVVHLPTSVVNDFAGRFDVGFKETKGVWIGDHHGRSGFIRHRCQRIKVHSAIGETRDFDDLKAGHGGTGWVGSVGRIRNDNFGSLVFSTVPEVFLNATDSSKLSLRSSHGLKGHLVHPCTDFEHVLHLIEN